MVIKKCHLVLGFAFIFAMAVSMVMFSVPMTATSADEAAVEIGAKEEPAVSGAASSDFEGDGNNLDLSKLSVGDCIAMSGVKKLSGLFEAVIGEYSHIGIYIGNGILIDSWPGDGVRKISVDSVHTASKAAIIRVSTSSSIKVGAINFCNSKVGLPYDYALIFRQVYGSSYYCSEICWAGYKAAGGPDIDRHSFSFPEMWGCAPQEIVEDGNTYTVTVAN